MSKQRLLWWWLVPAFLVMFWLGAHGLSVDALWGDEFFSILDAGGGAFERRNPIEIWNGVAERHGVHPPGYYIVLSGWGALTGWEPPILRALSLFVGVLAAAWTYRLGRALLSRQAALYSTLVLSTSAFFVNYLHELRMYSFVALFTALTLWAYERVLRRQRHPSRMEWTALFVGTVGLLYSHYFAALLLIAIGAYHLLFAPKNRRWWQISVVMTAAGAVFLPWMGGLAAGLTKAESYTFIHERALNAGAIVGTTITLFSHGASPLLVLALAFALRARGRKIADTWYFTLALLVVILGVNAVIEIILRPRIRYLISLWPLLSLLVGVGIAEMARVRWRGTQVGQAAALGFLGVWMALGFWNSLYIGQGVTRILDGTEYSFPMHDARDLLGSRTQPGDALVTYLPDPLGTWMYGGIDQFYYGDMQINSFLAENRGDDEKQDEQTETMMSAIGDRLRVWVTYAEPVPTTLAGFEQALTERYSQCGTVDEHGVHADLYTQSRVCCLPEMSGDAPLAAYGEAVSLNSLEPPEPDGGVLPMLIGWSVAQSVPPNTYSVALHVVDENGSLAAQGDYGLPAQSFSCQRTPIDVSLLPNGDYTVRVGVYAWENGQHLAGRLYATGESGDLVTVGEFTLGT